jgi:ABC-2 type transport system ATP-binding protein
VTVAPERERTAVPGEPEIAVRASGLRRTFGKTVAVDSLDLEVRQAEIFGLVGPDGAGKTTTFRLLIGLLKPDAGYAWLGGIDVHRSPQEARALVGYVAQNFTLYGDLSVMENLQFTARVRNLPRSVFEERCNYLLELTELAPFPKRLAGDLSGGMKRKLALACALIHRPQILLLDEPTTGVDPVSRREFWRMLYGLPAEGVTLVVSTPYMDEAERCHRLGFMGRGRLLALDSPTGLLSRMPDALVEVRTADRTHARKLLSERTEVRRVETVGGALRIAIDPALGAGPGADGLRTVLQDAGVPVQSCEPVTPTLNDVFTALSDTAGAAP